jgi:hypothetical protein
MYLPGARATDELTLDLRRNVVRISARWENDAMRDGFGFVVGERDSYLYIVTADHVVRGAELNEIDRGPSVEFYGDRGTPHKAELLGPRLGPFEGDIAVLKVQNPVGVSWRRDALNVNTLKRGMPVWFIGLARDWFVPVQPGVVNSVEPYGTFIAEGLRIAVGTSGAPLISETGIAGIIVEDSGSFTRASPIELVERAFIKWGYPWNLTVSPGEAPINQAVQKSVSPGQAPTVPGAGAASPGQTQQAQMNPLGGTPPESGNAVASAPSPQTPPTKEISPPIIDMQRPIDGVFDAWRRLDIQGYAAQWAADAVHYNPKTKETKKFTDLIKDREANFRKEKSVDVDYHTKFQNLVDGVGTFNVAYTMKIRHKSGTEKLTTGCEVYKVRNSKDGSRWLIFENRDNPERC